MNTASGILPDEDIDSDADDDESIVEPENTQDIVKENGSEDFSCGE